VGIEYFLIASITFTQESCNFRLIDRFLVIVSSFLIKTALCASPEEPWLPQTATSESVKKSSFFLRFVKRRERCPHNSFSFLRSCFHCRRDT